MTAARHQLTRLQQAADSPRAPRPLRDRAAGQAARLQAIINRHDATRPGTTGQEEMTTDAPPAA
jgi:hypothetical protein